MSDVVLEIKNLTRRFGAFTAVDALTLSVNAGEVFGCSFQRGGHPDSQFSNSNLKHIL
jgi:ABC-type branched-subunit amino acid transport system ATPase component